MNPTRSEEARQLARRIAYRVWAGHWDAETYANDCESEAWVQERPAGPDATVHTIAVNALRRVRSGTHFRQSISSIDTQRTDHPKRKRKRPRVTRRPFDPRDYAHPGSNPGKSVPLFIDFRVWIASYSPRKRAILLALAMGRSTNEVAGEFSLTAARISQLRREFERDWKAFQS